MRTLACAALALLLASPPVAARAAEDDAAEKPAGAAVGSKPAKPKREPSITALVRAAALPDTGKLRVLLRAGAPVNGTTPRDETPLQAAAAEGLAANVFTLLAGGAEIDRLAGRGLTALGWAARGGHEQTVRMLLDAGADPDRAASPDRSPMALAAAREHHTIVALLIERGSKVFETPPLAGAVLLAVSQTTSVELAGLVVPRMAGMLATAPGLRESAANAIAGSSAVLSQAMLSRLGPEARTGEFQSALLFAAVRRGRHDVASAALSAGANVNQRRGANSPLGVAVALGDSSMVTLLLSSNADSKAADVDQAKLAELAGSEVNERDQVDRLADLGQIDRFDENGETMLFRAAQRGNFLTVKRLLARGANPETTVTRWPGDAGWTPLMTAAAGNQIAVVKLLLAGGAPVDQRNAAGRTALFFAAFYGRATIVDMLVGAGADPRAADLGGQTPTALASASGDTATVLRMSLSLRATAEAGGAAPAQLPPTPAEPR